MEENKSKKSGGVSLVLVIAILVIALVACIAYIMKNNEQKLALNNNNSEKTINELRTEITNLKNEIAEKDKNQYEKIKGTYEYSTENYSGYEGIYIGYILSLKDDGTFNYEIAIDNAGGFCGNYIINGSEIVLNKLFNYGSDVGINLISGQVKINDNGTISDSNKYEESPMSSVVLTKNTTQVNENLKDRIYAAIKGNAISAENQ